MGSAILLARGGELLRSDISRSTLVVSGSDLPLKGVTFPLGGRFDRSVTAAYC